MCLNDFPYNCTKAGYTSPWWLLWQNHNFKTINTIATVEVNYIVSMRGLAKLFKLAWTGLMATTRTMHAWQVTSTLTLRIGAQHSWSMCCQGSSVQHSEVDKFSHWLTWSLWELHKFLVKNTLTCSRHVYCYHYTQYSECAVVCYPIVDT